MTWIPPIRGNEYIYVALLLHKVNRSITEDNVKNVIKATGTTPDDVKVKALVASLSEINIDEALKAGPLATVAPSINTATADSGTSPKQEEKKEEKKEEEALEGLSALFG